MNGIIYYSNTNESYNISKYIASKTGYDLLDINKLNNFNYDNLFLIFPVHYQSIPKEIRNIIKKITAKKAVVVATYGKISYGRVLYDLQKILNAKIVAGAYVPVKHTYIVDDHRFNSFGELDPIIDRINDDTEIMFTKTKRNIFSGFMPIIRHQLSIKITKTDKCINCGKCNTLCNYIDNGKIISNKCNRCLKCVNECDYNGLDFKTSRFMNRYLKKKKKNEDILYLIN